VIALGISLMIAGLWVITQSMSSARLGPSLATIGAVLVLVGLFK